jgi:ammonia channel protein AmtB
MTPGLLAFYGGGQEATRMWHHHPVIYISLLVICIISIIWKRTSN